MISLLRRLRAKLPYIRTQQAIWKQLSELSAQLSDRVAVDDHRAIDHQSSANHATIESHLQRLERQLATLGDHHHATHAALKTLGKRQDDTLGNLAWLLSGTAPSATDGRVPAHGYRVFSQFDEDGLIQFLIARISIPNQTFIEFGVEDYIESNTRFLLTHNNWSGLVMDCSDQQVQAIKASDYYWRHNLKVQSALVTRENINELFRQAGLSGDIGLLSIDVDGIDYWLWEACAQVSPRIVVVEYNAVFGKRSTVTVPYDPCFDRSTKHYSHIYAGASLGALSRLGKHKGYSLVASNSAGNNAFFVRNDCLGELRERTVEEVYVKAQFRESRGTDGQLTYLPIEESINLIFDLPVVDVTTDETRLIRELDITYA